MTRLSGRLCKPPTSFPSAVTSGVPMRRISAQARTVSQDTTGLKNSKQVEHPHFLKAQFWRGGTSNGIILNARVLPGWETLKAARHKSPAGFYSATAVSEMIKHAEKALEPIFGAMMGSPDPRFGRQLNGMGGGLSSLSKAVIVDVATRSENQDYMSQEYVDIDYCFVQIGIKDGKLDMSGNCGNMTSAVAPFALNNRMLNLPKHLLTLNSLAKKQAPDGEQRIFRQEAPLTVRLRNLNTMKRIDAKIFCSIPPDGNGKIQFQQQGSYNMDGVPGCGSPITLSFLEPGGAKTGKAMPTGNAIDEWEIQPGEKVRASLLDISNPGVFIDGRTVGWDPSFTPEQLNYNTDLMAKLEAIRREGASRMGLNPETPSIPKIVMLFPPVTEDVDITCQAISMGQAHKATPVTLALNLAAACKIPGSIAHELARSRDPVNTIVGHPSGKLEVGAEVGLNGEIISAKLVRTARCLMYGAVNAEPGDDRVQFAQSQIETRIRPNLNVLPKSERIEV